MKHTNIVRNVNNFALPLFINTLMVLVILSANALISCSPGDSDEKEINRVIRPYHFSITSWQITAITNEFNDWLVEDGTGDYEGVAIVREYFENVASKNNTEAMISLAKDGLYEADIVELQSELKKIIERNNQILPMVESAISSQIESVLHDEGIINPSQTLDNFKLFFPPVNFIIQPPPHLLVISPRDEITRLKDITLVQDLSEAEKEQIENEIENLELSALIVRLGGIATYPAFVAENASLKRTLDVVVEEWFHQYLFFKPLGFLYGLHVAGIKQDYEIATVNEAFAGIVSGEIADKVYRKYYQPDVLTTHSEIMSSETSSEEAFDFYAEMRRIRLTVDDYLDRGMVEEAEEYMEEQRLFLASHGYIIRKLNQAFFAFYGTYADSPISVSPIGAGLRQLRQEAESLKDYIENISAMTDSQAIIAAAPEDLN